MGKQSVLWKKIENYYTMIPLDQNSTCKTIKYQCNFCTQIYACNVTRMSQHLMMDCINTPLEVKNDIKNIYIKPETTSSSTHIKLNARWGQVSKHFVKLNAENFPGCKKDKYMCIYCNSRYANNVTRMAQHVMECVDCPLPTKNEFYKLSKPKTPPPILEGVPSTSNYQYYEDGKQSLNDHSFFFGSEFNSIDTIDPISSNSYDEEMEHIEQKYDVTKHVDGIENIETHCESIINTTDKEEENELKILLARACYATSTSLKIFENKYWKKVFKKINPNLTLPSQSELTSDYLDQEYIRISNEVERKIKNARKFGLELHGVHDHKGLTHIIVIITTPEPVVYKIIEKEYLPNMNYINDTILKIIEENSDHIFITLIYKNITIQDLSHQLNSKFPNKYVSCYKCNTYTLKLLIKDIMKLHIFKNVLSKYKSLMKEIHFQNTTPECFKTQKDNEYIRVPSIKYWKLTYNNLEKLIKNKNVLQYFVKSSENLQLTKETQNNILDEIQFWPYIELLYKIMKHIIFWLNKMKHESCLSIVVESYSNLNSLFKETCSNLTISEIDTNEILQCLEKNRNLIIEDIHKAASLLDPYYMGKNLSPDDIIDAIEFINKVSKVLPHVKSDKIMYDIAAYRTKQGIWAKEFVWDSLTTNGNDLPAIIWWQSMCTSTELSKIAGVILNCSPIVISIYDSCKTYRNKISKKMNFIKYNLNLLPIKDKLYGSYKSDQIEDESITEEDSNYSSDSDFESS